MKELLVEEGGAGGRMDKYLKRCLPGAPESLLYAQLRKKNITLNGKKAAGRELLRTGDRIQCFFSDATWEKFRRTEEVEAQERARTEAARRCFRRHPDIKICFSADGVRIADKPAGLLTQGANADDESLDDWILGYLLETEGLTADDLALFVPSACHRLDRNTGGLVICATTANAARIISEAIRMRRVGKYYLALLHGRVDAAGRASASLIKDAATNTVSVGDRAGAQPIETAWVPVFYDAENDISVVLASPLTGRPHQLRAHFADMGHPVVGDRKYGGISTARDRDRFGAAAQELHACLLRFPETFGLPVLAGQTVYSAPSSRAFSVYAARTGQEKLTDLIDRHAEVFAHP